MAGAGPRASLEEALQVHDSLPTSWDPDNWESPGSEHPASPDDGQSADQLVQQGFQPTASNPRTPRRLTAADFTPELYGLHGLWVPSSGWRGWLYRLTAGRIAPGPSAAELTERELLRTAVTPVHGCQRIAVLSRKGGVGKTTTAIMLGHMLASLRGDRVAALDGNPDAGSLGYRIRRETSATVTDLLRDADQVRTAAQIRAYTSQAPSRLEVIASDPDPRITRAMSATDIQQVIALLAVWYHLLVLDTGTGVMDSANQGILEHSDQLVVVVAPSLDAARGASATLDWLEQQGRGELVAGAVAVINQVLEPELAADQLNEHFDQRCRAVVRVPHDPHLAVGAEATLQALQPATRHAYLELAAAVGDGFRDQQPPRDQHQGAQRAREPHA